MTKLHEQLLEFHKTFDHAISEKPTEPDDALARLRVRLILEEAFEFAEACVHKDDRWKISGWKEYALRMFEPWRSEPICGREYRVRLKPDMVEMADALADIDYVVEGARISLGIDGGPIADEVHRSNLLKKGATKDAGGKVQKPAGWSPPDIAKCLIEQGWAPGE